MKFERYFRILVIIFGVTLLVAEIMIGLRMWRNDFQASSTASSSVSHSSASKSGISSEYLWHGKDIRKSGTGVYPGMSRERACQQAGTEAAYWLMNGTGSQRYEELYKRFALVNFVTGSDKIDLDSTAHWVNHVNPPYTAVPETLALTGTATTDENAVGCVVSIDGKAHSVNDAPTSLNPYPKSGALYFQLMRKDKDSAWFVLNISYNPSNYQADIKNQGND